MRGRMMVALALSCGIALGCAGKKHATTRTMKGADAERAELNTQKQREADAAAVAQRDSQERKRAAEQQKRQAEVNARADQQRRSVALAESKNEAKVWAAERREQAKRDKKMRREQAERDEEMRRDAEREAKKRERERRGEIGNRLMMHEDEPTLLDAFVEAQAAAGAAEDANFTDQHFDDNQLNSLGRSKLALILERASANAPVTVYVAGDEGVSAARIAPIRQGWKDSGRAGVSLQVQAGHNLVVTTPSSVGLRGLEKLEKENTGRTVNINMTGTSGASAPANTRP